MGGRGRLVLERPHTLFPRYPSLANSVGWGMSPEEGVCAAQNGGAAQEGSAWSLGRNDADLLDRVGKETASTGG